MSYRAIYIRRVWSFFPEDRQGSSDYVSVTPRPPSLAAVQVPFWDGALIGRAAPVLMSARFRPLLRYTS